MDNKATWPGWETVRLIGRGSFGAVYEIERNMLGEKEKAALKVITIPQSSSDIDDLYGEGFDEESITSTFKEQLRSIVAEYSLMRRLNGNSNVVNCDDVRYIQHDDGFGWDIFIKMELLTPMNKALGKEVPDGQVIRVGSDMCRALMLCKKHSIIHRDIKPANIFVSENGDYKLGDFGIAKTVEKTSGGTKIGTYEYMAPEVYHDRPYGSTADIYSLGMVLYWLLNERRTPFLKLPPSLPTSAEKERARKRRFAGEPLPPPAHGSEELKKIVLKACAYDPQERYQSAEEMLRDLEALVAASAPAKSVDDEATVLERRRTIPDPELDEVSTVVERKTEAPLPPASAETGAPGGPSPDDEGTTIEVINPAAPVPPTPTPVSPASAGAGAPNGPPSDDDEDGTIGVFGRRIDKAEAPASAEAGVPDSSSSDDEDATVGAPLSRASAPDEDATVPSQTYVPKKRKEPEEKETAAEAATKKKKFPLWIPIVGVLAAAVIALLFITGVLGSGKVYPADWANKGQDGISIGWHGTEVLNIRPEGSLIRVKVYDWRKVPKSSDGSRWSLTLGGPSDDSGHLYIDNTGYTFYYQYSESDQAYHEIISQSTEISWDGGRTYSFTIHPAVFNGYSWRDISSVDLYYLKAIKVNGTMIQYGVCADLTSIPAPANEVKIGLICTFDENFQDDAAFINGFNEACDKLGVEGIIKTNVPESIDSVNVAHELVDAGCNIIFSTSYGFCEYMRQAAQELPEVQFVAFKGDDALTAGIENYHNANVAEYEGRYVTGVAAGMKLNEMISSGAVGPDCKIGYVASFGYAEEVSSFTAFFLGARSVCPSVTMDVAHTNLWYDPETERGAAETLIAGGCVLLSQSSASYGVPLACDIYGVPNVPCSAMAGNYASYLTAYYVNWEPCFEHAIHAVMYGENLETDWCGTLSTGSIGLCYVNDDVAAEGTDQTLSDTMRALADGSLHVFDVSSFTIRGEHPDSLLADVIPDQAYTTDTEAVWNGYFHECELRSAPYFNYIIDGINILQ